jgi:hypothetical protein
MLSGVYSLQAQLETSADFRRTVYDREYTIGISGHSRGYTLNGRYLKYQDGFVKQGFEIDLVKLRHPKEVRSTIVSSGSRGFVFGRINSFYSLRGGYIREEILYDKTDQGTVSISLVTSGGLSLGLLKPVFVDVLVEDELGRTNPVAERYNPPEQNASILGESGWFTGITKTQLRPGIYAKVGVAFDYDFLDSKVTSLEAGIIYDYFFVDVPIFYEPSGEDLNIPGFFQVYIAANFGYKKN